MTTTTFDSTIGLFPDETQLTIDSHAEDPFLEIRELRARLAEVEQEKSIAEQRLHSIEKDLKSSKDIIAELRIAFTNINRRDITQYELDMKRLAEKLIIETELRGEVEHAKFKLENELEELSIQLFEEANKMVVEQRKVCAEMKRKNLVLERQLEEYRELSRLQSEQLTELKCNFIKPGPTGPYNNLPPLIIPADKKPANVEIFNNPFPSPESSVYTNDLASNDAESVLSELEKRSVGSCVCSDDSSLSGAGLFFNQDDIRYAEFREFLLQPPKTILQSRFVKRCIVEDIDLLLRFDTSAVGVRSWFQQRKLAAAAQTGTILIEPVFTSDERKEASSLSCCSLCNQALNDSQASYTYRLEDDDAEAKALCCFCRERLVSVCDFYSFLRMIHSGLLKSSHEKLYNDCLRLRLKMFLARVGSHVCYESEEEHGKYGYLTPRSPDGP
ncbi:hypothetical protein K493DRAFT_355581 [Basidiobolus meristosporus CBS 931.73]|uniref:GDP/GTP exchange factor Sec2 N-terminal domain-containing protein n=1 Tax=Basidiobolus meristosporus CBS 931.73 TaxID=1314790 RepID=A0A1Y1Y0B2_9FUNG|nr:hypothetical protein K493DRAFT_355581 [Basidiobolus meristosporus CBS 931.73]|eukprot:ORX91437.1 hypothetical protein K493DRAFT_355581 [Basidiobolus meristosporus CBS 931.73]